MLEGAQEMGNSSSGLRAARPARLGREHGGGAPPLLDVWTKPPLQENAAETPANPTCQPCSPGLVSPLHLDTLDNGGPCGRLPFRPNGPKLQDVLEHLLACDWRASDEVHRGSVAGGTRARVLG